MRSLLRIKRYHDGLRRFLPPEVADLVAADPAVLESHRREVAVLSCGLSGFAAFAESAAPEDVMTVLDGYHAALGAEIVAASFSSPPCSSRSGSRMSSAGRTASTV